MILAHIILITGYARIVWSVSPDTRRLVKTHSSFDLLHSNVVPWIKTKGLPGFSLVTGECEVLRAVIHRPQGNYCDSLYKKLVNAIHSSCILVFQRMAV